MFFGQYLSYTSISTDANPLGWGLAGSIVAEAISFKDTTVLILYPLIMVVYGYCINVILKTKTMSGYILFIVALMYIQQMFRYSFMEFAFYPFYNVIFVGFWVVVLDLMHGPTHSKELIDRCSICKPAH